jgi:hypothetical protein
MDDIKHWTTIPGGVDIAMLGSVKRPDAEKTSDNPLGLHRGLIGTASPNRYLAKKTDGSVEILVLYGNAQEQEKVLSKPEYERVLYLDVK